jgi:hypothetical protein
MSDNNSTSSQIGSALGGLFSGLLQMQLLSSPEFVKSTQNLFVANLRMSAQVLKSTIALSRNQYRDQSPYNRDLMFEGQVITPAARDRLISMCENLASYDDLNRFTQRLAWWIFEKDPYMQDVPSPPAPAVRQTGVGWTAYIVGTGISIIIAIAVGVSSSLWVTAFMLPVLGISMLFAHRQRTKPQLEPEWAWLLPYQYPTQSKSDELPSHT